MNGVLDMFVLRQKRDHHTEAVLEDVSLSETLLFGAKLLI